MSLKNYDENCSGCRPVIASMKTGQRAPADLQVLVDLIWDTASKTERAAFHHVTCQNSRAPMDMLYSMILVERIEVAVNAARGNEQGRN